MPLTINNGEDEVVTGCFSMWSRASDDFVNVFITDRNPQISKRWVEETEVNEACFTPRRILFNIDRGTNLLQDSCPPPHPYQPPDTYCSEKDIAATQQNENHLLPYSQNPAPAIGAATGNYIPNADDVLVYGFNTQGGINRSGSQMLTYHYKIPLTTFPSGFSLLQVYLEEKSGLHTLLFQKNVESSTATVTAHVVPPDFNSLITAVTDDKLKEKADKAELIQVKEMVDKLKSEETTVSSKLNEVTSGLAEVKEFIKTLSDTYQKPNLKSKPPQ